MPIGDTELPHWHVNMFRQRGSHENFLLQEMWNQSQGLRAVRLSFLPFVTGWTVYQTYKRLLH